MKWERYWEAIERRWLMIVTVCALTLLVALGTYERAKQEYSLTIRFIVGQLPLESTLELEEERYHGWTTSEYVVHSINDWTNGTGVAQLVSERLIAKGYEDLDTEAVDIAMLSQSSRSQLTIRIVHKDKDTLQDFADIVVAVIEDNAGLGIPQLQNAEAKLFLIDDTPVYEDYIPSIIGQMGMPLRLMIGLISGFALAGTLEFFDPTIRYRESAESLNIPILGEIPKG